ncbi:ash family protein [Methylomonas koyamae]|uniref:Uncharacterized protein n=1 Tax=Methylomonas koyamae TaxID=702114 RepID=A0AA91D9Y6_9GAMM|nr:ash family protein [Methylomonas koyamae]OAI22785.1 hypothetical protein A1356_18800 [Methylomonas koyamae]
MLTLSNCSANLFIAGNKSAGFRSLKSNGVKTPIQGVFYCPKKMITAFFRAFFMVARSGQPKGWPAPLPGTANLLRVAAQQFAVVGGGSYIQAMEPSK